MASIRVRVGQENAVKVVSSAAAQGTRGTQVKVLVENKVLKVSNL